MKALLIAALAALPLAGCMSTSQQADVVSAVTKACSAEAAAYASYSSLVAGGVLKANSKVEAAQAGIGVICANPAGMADPYSALAQVTAAAIVVANAMKAA